MSELRPRCTARKLEQYQPMQCICPLGHDGAHTWAPVGYLDTWPQLPAEQDEWNAQKD